MADEAAAKRQADENAARARQEAVKQQLDEGRAMRERSYAEFQERMKSKPTPTQEENDRAVLGEHVLEKEDDGSGPDLGVQLQQRQSLAQPGKGGYQTRTAQPQTPPKRPE
jgi:uncharacterized protein with von Willebrand factor type A (vWA) domain